jgi:hypothetical protein
LALAQTKPSSCLKFLLHCSTHLVPFSKMILFLMFHRIQHAMLTISLKIMLLKSALACRIMSRGLRFRFQIIGIVSQQSLLNEHSKKR